MNDYQDVEFTDQDALRQYEAMAVLLEAMTSPEKLDFVRKFSSLAEELDGRQREIADDFLEGIELLEDED